MARIGEVVGRLTGVTEQRLKHELANERRQTSFLEENFQDLERHILTDAGWRRLGAEMDREFTRDGLDEIVKVSRALYMAHPLIKRACDVTAFYVWGQGVEIASKDDAITNDIINPLVNDESNRIELYGHQSRVLTELDQMVDGNVFMALFTGADGHVQIRSVPTEDIRQVWTHPEDRNQVCYYKRVWTVRNLSTSTGVPEYSTETAYYPDIRWNPRGTERVDKINGHEVRWDSPIIHSRSGMLKQMRFGVPETYSAFEWARAYKKFLEDWHSIVSSLSRFAWRMSSKNKKKIARAKDRLNTKTTSGEMAEHDPDDRPPSTGAIFAGMEGDTMTPIPKTGATVGSEDARPSRLMVAAASGMPDTILSGDVDVGNFATSKTLDRPTELGFRNRQLIRIEFDKAILRYSLDQKIRKSVDGFGKYGTVKDMPDGNSIVMLREEPSLEVVFPPILEREAKDVVSALVSAATLDGKSNADTFPREELSKMLMQAVGVENIEQALKDLPEEDPEAQAALNDAMGKLNQAAEALLESRGDRR